jgi:hypothetical protein
MLATTMPWGLEHLRNGSRLLDFQKNPHASLATAANKTASIRLVKNNDPVPTTGGKAPRQELRNYLLYTGALLKGNAMHQPQITLRPAVECHD